MKVLLLHLCFFFLMVTDVFAMPKEAVQKHPVSLRCEHMENPLGIDFQFPRLSWQIGDQSKGAAQSAYQILINRDSVRLENGEASIWDSKKVKSDSILISYNGQPLKPFTKYYWKVKYWDQNGKASGFSKISTFETGMMQISNWRGEWISDGMPIEYKPAPYFRKTFRVNKRIISARAYVAVAGLYELYINGKKVGDRLLDPMFTRFDRRTLYTTFDVSEQLKEGDNALGVILGNGWYNLQSTAVWYFDKAPWRSRPKFCIDLRIYYEDGSLEVISSDGTWKTTESPIIYNSIYTGEYYDARKELPGWNTTEFDDREWKAATLTPAPSTNIVSQVLHPIRVVEELKPASFKEINDRTYLYTFPRNIAGITRLTAKGKSETVIKLKHGEVLDDQGNLNQDKIANKMVPSQEADPFQTDIYILKGEEEQTFAPRFNYKGFQYVEVSSSQPVMLTQNSLAAEVVHTDVPSIGSVNTSDKLINQIFDATNYSYLNNLHGYPTDCPHREKNGWTGDAHLTIETALYGFDGITIYEKWLQDHLDEQLPNGVLPNIIPSSGWGYHWANGTDWTSSIAIIPWQVYQFYGDPRLLAITYDGIKKYVDLLERRSSDGLINWALGDWIPIRTKSNTELISSLYFYSDVSILSKSAKLLGKKEDFKKYSLLADKVKNAINKKFLNPQTGIYASGSQTEQSAALCWGIVPEEVKTKVVENLVKNVSGANNHMDVGLLGAKTLFNALSENGHADLAFTVMAQDTYPSFGYWMVNGATTLYEHWNIEKDKIASLNHIMFSECAAWLYKAVAGIFPDPEAPGFKNILLKPAFIKSLQHIEANHVSPFGNIVSGWERTVDGICYRVTIPANSTATLYMPFQEGVVIKESGMAVEKNKFIRRLAKNDKYYQYSLSAGSYHFTIENATKK